MRRPLLLLLLPIAASELCMQPEYQYYVCQNNTVPCPDGKRCAFVEHCPAVASLMCRNELPVHRLRQAVCGYDQTRVKICCDPSDYFYQEQPPLPPHATPDLYPMRSFSNLACGKSLVQSNVDTLGSYPFVARIGFTSKYFHAVTPAKPERRSSDRYEGVSRGELQSSLLAGNSLPLETGERGPNCVTYGHA